MRLLTWNTARKRYDTSLARAAMLNPDILILQESWRPDALDAVSPHAAWFGSNPRQSVVIADPGDYRVAAEPVRRATRSMFAARVSGPLNFTIVAVHAQEDPTYSKALVAGLEVYRDLLLTGPVVLAGDFNSSAAWDDRHRRNDHRELDALLAGEYGLVSAYHAHTGERAGFESQPTHYWRWHEHEPYHLDYCYIPEAWVPGLREVTVGSYADWRDTSDHRPVVVEVVP